MWVPVKATPSCWQVGPIAPNSIHLHAGPPHPIPLHARSQPPPPYMWVPPTPPTYIRVPPTPTYLHTGPTNPHPLTHGSHHNLPCGYRLELTGGSHPDLTAGSHLDPFQPSSPAKYNCQKINLVGGRTQDLPPSTHQHLNHPTTTPLVSNMELGYFYMKPAQRWAWANGP
jgi:hypothetical protein